MHGSYHRRHPLTITVNLINIIIIIILVIGALQGWK
jgi:hypothetical protein